MGSFDQSDFDVRFEWGDKGVRALAPISDIVVIVDVLSFSTSVEISTSQGAVVFPFRWGDGSVEDFARRVGAEVADARNFRGCSLSPSTLVELPPSYRMVLPSPNGSELSLLPDRSTVVAGCLRNATAVAQAISSIGGTVAVVACGERWEEDQSLRPCVEDVVGAGAILRHLKGPRSPEADGAIAVFEGLKDRLLNTLLKCASGREKIHAKKDPDVHLAAALNVSQSVPVLQDGAYRVMR